MLPACIGISERSLEYRGVSERSEKVGIERSFKEDSRIESHKCRERVWDKIIIKKWENDYLNKTNDRIDKLICVFCKNDTLIDVVALIINISNLGISFSKITFQLI